MGPKVREEAMRRKTQDDVRRASTTYAELEESRRRDARFRTLMRVLFCVGGFMCGMESIMEITYLVFFGIVGPIALHFDMI